MQKLRQRKRLKLLLLLSFITSFCVWGCTKIDVTKESLSNEQIQKADNFFKVSPKTDPIVLRIIDEIKKRNNKKEFVSDFAINNGYPIWDKAILGNKKKNTNSSSFSGGNSSDTLVFIPFALANQQFVNGYILATMTDSIGLSYSLAKDYKAYAFNGDSTQFSASNFAMRIMIMEKEVFGYSQFNITDKRLFHEQNSNYNDTSLYNLQITLNEPAPSNSNSLLASYCYTSTQVHICSVCNLASCTVNPPWTTTSINCIWYDDGTGPGGNPPTGGGGGGGGDIPPAFPCTPIANQSLTGQQNTGSSSVLPGGPLPPCPGPGVGWVPTPQLTDPISPINDSIPNILSRVCNNQADSVFNWGLQNNNVEQSFIIVLKDGLVYTKNFNRGDSNGDGVSVNYTLAQGEKLLCYVHTHPDTAPRDRSSFSPEDFIELTKNRTIPGYTAILECGNVRYALVIEDLTKLNIFTSTRRPKDLKTDWANAIYSQPNIYSNGPQACVDGIIQYLGSVSVCGVGFYRATAPDKNNFIKLNP